VHVTVHGCWYCSFTKRCHANALASMTFLVCSFILCFISASLTLIISCCFEWLTVSHAESQLDCPTLWAADCAMGFVWVKRLCTCVPEGLASSSLFLAMVQREKTCPGTAVAGRAGLESLRFCTVVNGKLTIENTTAAAALGPSDWSALQFITTVGGY
jgi:hypothetical protein